MKEQTALGLDERFRTLKGLCKVNYGIFSMDTRTFSGGSVPKFCEVCEYSKKNLCTFTNVHLYGCYEADRWGGKYIYFCPCGLAFCAASVYEETELCGGVVTGPVIIGDLADLAVHYAGEVPELFKKLPKFSPKKTNELLDMTLFLANPAHSAEQDRDDYLNTMYEVSESFADSSAPSYPIQDERKLQSYIATGDKENSQKLLNQLLGYIYFANGMDFNDIKMRVIELIVLLSRASIEGGADVRQVFWLNKGYIKDATDFRNLDDLSRWLSGVMHRFISYVFDFNDVKHVDVIHKTMSYIKENYHEKISLDNAARHVHLSKTYLSRVFNDEIGSTFTDYVNKLRVEKSKSLLLAGDRTIVQIANDVGFEDQSYFTKVFKKTVGISPGKFRELRGKTINKK